MRAPSRLCAAFFVAIALGAASCSGSSAPKAHGTTTSTTIDPTTGVVVQGSVQLRLTAKPVHTVAVGASMASGAPLQAARGVIRQYLTLALVDALSTGHPGKGLGALFSTGAAKRAGGIDASVVTDNGLGPARTPTTVSGTLQLSTLVDGNRTLAAVTAALDTKAIVTGPHRRVSVARKGEILLMPAFGTWHIVGYDLTVTRTDLTTGAASTTSATTGATAP